jgi:hypothetical protein
MRRALCASWVQRDFPRTAAVHHAVNAIESCSTQSIPSGKAFPPQGKLARTLLNLPYVPL